MTTPRVSIITGTYNSARYLARYFATLEAQTFCDWEAVLVDDGSKDETVALVAAKAKSDARYRLLQKTPEGLPSRSRAFGLKAARGEYVAFLDHDDFWAPEKLAMQVAVLERHPETAILHTDRVVWTTLDAPASPFLSGYAPDAAPVRDQRPEDVIYRGLQIIFSSFMAPRALVRSIGFHPDMRGVDDFYLFIRLAQLGPIRRIELPLTYYYAHQGNLSHASDIFVAGFYKVLDVLRDDDVSATAKKAMLAMACRTEAVSLLARDRGKALRLLVKSLRAYYIPSTLTRLAFLLVTLPLPLRLQERLFRLVKALKFRFPTLKDLIASRGK